MSENNSFTSHFVELRSRLIKTIAFILIIFIGSYTFAEQIYAFLVNPYAEAVKGDQISRRFYSFTRNIYHIFKSSFFCCYFFRESNFIDSNL